MIAFLSGTVKERSDEAVFMEVNGIGFRILMATSALQQVRIGEKLLIHTYLSIKKMRCSLYGFLDQAEKALFIKLINVSGVGTQDRLGYSLPFSADRVLPGGFKRGC